MLRNFSSYYIGSKPTNQISHAILPKPSPEKYPPGDFFGRRAIGMGGICREDPLYGLFTSYKPLFYIFIS